MDPAPTPESPVAPKPTPQRDVPWREFIALWVVLAGLVVGVWAVARPRPGATVPTPRQPTLAELTGEWKATASGRRLMAVKKGDELEFHVIDGAEFDGAYAVGDVRFRLRVNPAGGYLVTEHYRATPLKGVSYAPGALVTCTDTRSEVNGLPLDAKLVADALDVAFARYESDPAEIFTDQDPSVITMCGAKVHKAVAIVRVSLKRK